MITKTASFLTFSYVITLLACSCLTVDCGYDMEVNLRLTRNNQDALFGPDAFLNRDSIRITTDDDRYPMETFINYRDNTQMMSAYLHDGPIYFLEINGARIDTIEITTELVSRKGCCDDYDFTGIILNGETVCSKNCEEGIEIEI